MKEVATEYLAPWLLDFLQGLRLGHVTPGEIHIIAGYIVIFRDIYSPIWSLSIIISSKNDRWKFKVKRLLPSQLRDAFCNKVGWEEEKLQEVQQERKGAIFEQVSES